MSLLTASSVFCEKNEGLEQGSWHIGGNISMPIKWVRGGDPVIKLKGSPQLGYFVLNGLELELKLAAEGDIYRKNASFTEDPLRIGVGVGLTYYLNFGWPVQPYLGANILLDTNWKKFGESLLIHYNFPIGVLVPINKNISISISAPLTVTWQVFAGFDDFSWDPFTIGVEAFF